MGKVPVRHAFVRFALVGIVGFQIDAGGLLAALFLGADFYTGRLISFASAVTATWYINRVYTFASRDSRLLREWARFVSANAVGGAINYLTYALLVAKVDWFTGFPVAAVAVGSLAGLLWNFTLSHKVVFIKGPEVEQ